MCGIAALGTVGKNGAQACTGCGVFHIDRSAQLCSVVITEQTLQRHGYLIRIAQVLCTVSIGSAHRFNIDMRLISKTQ